MKRLLFLLGSFTFASGLSAFAPHPTSLTVRHDEEEVRRVIQVRGDNPCILSGGKIRELRWAPKYVLQRGRAFADNRVESSTGSLAGKVPPQDSSRAQSDIAVSLRAEKTIQHGFSVVVAYVSRPDDDPRLESTTINVRELPPLPAGQAVAVGLSLAKGTPANADYFIQIFDDEGLEVMTNGVEHAWAYYTLRNLDRLSVAVDDYLKAHPGADHEAVPFDLPKPSLRAGAVPASAKITASLTISAAGWVSAVEVEGVEDSAVRQSIIATLEGWLFLPKLTAGQPVPVKVAVPLQL